MTALQLGFSGDCEIELNDTLFTLTPSSEAHRTVRGRTSGAFIGYGTFQWSHAVRALSTLFLKYAAACSNHEVVDAKLSGSHGSLAASLDYAIDKGPVWLADMFGLDSQGRMLARRAFLRTNPGRKRAGPVVIAVNSSFLASQSIKISLNGVPLREHHELALLAKKLEESSSDQIDQAALKRVA